MNWQPIETAPKSALMGQILTYRHNGPNWTKGGGGGPHFQTSFWSAKHELWVGWPLNIQPTHWMPLPAAPATVGRERLAMGLAAPDEALRLAVERTRDDLGPDGTNYPAVRKLLAFAELAIECGQV